MSLMNKNKLAKTKTVGANKLLLLLGVPPLRVYTIRIHWAKLAIFNLYTQKRYSANGM